MVAYTRMARMGLGPSCCPDIAAVMRPAVQSEGTRQPCGPSKETVVRHDITHGITNSPSVFGPQVHEYISPSPFASLLFVSYNFLVTTPLTLRNISFHISHHVFHHIVRFVCYGRWRHSSSLLSIPTP